ncbi:DNA repair protein RadA [Myxococcaceae bacterium]|nr:DNA repair protein RadA [Myxococcaceae bacterium]
MARPRSVHACTECGAQSPRWLGRCPSCGGWNTLVEEPVGGAGESAEAILEAPRGAVQAIRLGDVRSEETPRFSSGISELDRVLGGGIVPGAVLLLGGEPGVGKSTLALQLAAEACAAGRTVLYVCGEESPEQVRLRAERLPGDPAEVRVVAETRVEALGAVWRETRPELVIVDSIQTMRTDRVESAPGSVSQVRECAALLAAAAKTGNTAVVLVGHVTKEGAIAGPRVLEHLVDVVLTFEGDRSHAVRALRATKNRFGSTQEVGVFAMTGSGLEGVENPSELFLAERRPGVPGSCIVPFLEGTRPMLLEVQALVAPAGYATARRTCLGIDDGRVALLLAVLERRAGIDLVSRDVYVNVTGGVRVAEPGADLGVALALASSRLDVPLPDDVAACGEIGLGGEVRRVGRIDLRVREAARLGFRRILLPERVGAALDAPKGTTLVSVADLAEAVRWLRKPSAPPRE